MIRREAWIYKLLRLDEILRGKVKIGPEGAGEKKKSANRMAVTERILGK